MPTWLWTLGRPLIQFVLIASALWTGLLTAFLSQVSCPDYRRLFWYVSLCGLVNLITIALVLKFTDGWTRWVYQLVRFAALLGLGELAVRVWLLTPLMAPLR